MKHEWRKHEKNIYLPKATPSFLDVPEFTYLTIEGIGNPNHEDFAKKVEVLYSLSYGVRMSYKWDNPPKDYYEYTVYPLEGLWDLIDPSKGLSSKDNLKYKIMIRQPSFLTKDLFEDVSNVVKKKKPNPLLDQVSLENIKDGKSIQMLHKGSYDHEPASFEIMETFCKNEGFKRLSKVHREIYLTDPRKTEPEKLKTVLRFQVE